MSLKRFAKKVKGKIVAMEPTSALSKWLIVNLYIFAQVLFVNYPRRKQSIYNVIYELKPELENNSREAKALYKEIMYCKFIYGIAAKEYFVYDFEKLSHEGRKLFVTRSNKYKYYRIFNDPNYIDFLNKKTETYRKFGRFYNRDLVCLYSEEDYDSFVEFVNKHNRFIYKPAEDYGGHGIEIYDINHFESLEELFRVIIFNGACVLEELIVQGKEIAQFHADSVNTVRLVTFLGKDGTPHVQWCFLRMGSGGSHTDNMSSGGIAANIDFETGIIYTHGRDWVGNEYMFHPDSKVQLVGFQMPEWDTVKSIIKDIANTMPQVRFVGWDLAYTTNGWIFVEGNAKPQCVAPQISKLNGKLHCYQSAKAIYDAELEAMMAENER